MKKLRRIKQNIIEMKVRPLCSVFKMKHGGERRRKILELIRQLQDDGRPGLAINNKWQLNLQKDPDLKRLLKEGEVKVDRFPKRYGSKINGKEMGRKRQTYLQLADKK